MVKDRLQGSRTGYRGQGQVTEVTDRLQGSRTGHRGQGQVKGSRTSHSGQGQVTGIKDRLQGSRTGHMSCRSRALSCLASYVTVFLPGCSRSCCRGD